MSGRSMTKLTSHRASKKPVNDNQVATATSSVSDTGSKASYVDQSPSGGKPPAAWGDRSQWGQSTAAYSTSSDDQWRAGGRAEDVEASKPGSSIVLFNYNVHNDCFVEHKHVVVSLLDLPSVLFVRGEQICTRLTVHMYLQFSLIIWSW